MYIELFSHIVYALGTDTKVFILNFLERRIMKFEKINDKQIRCTLDNSDLGERGINLSELAYGSEKAKTLFREMLQKASVELGFETENSPLMVEATPLSNESLLLIITKIDDPEELDTRFSKFSPSIEDELNSLIKHIDNINTLEGLSELKKEAPVSEPADKEKSEYYSRAFSFENLDTAIAACKGIKNTDTNINSSLYKNPSNGLFYLTLNNNALPDNNIFVATCNILSEYGRKIAFWDSTKAHFDEHFELIIKDYAISKLAGI